MLHLIITKRCTGRVWEAGSCVLEDSPSMQTYRLEIWERICCGIPPAQTACLLIAETFARCNMFNSIFIQLLQPDCDAVSHTVHCFRLALQKSLEVLPPSAIPLKICSLLFS